LVKPIAGPVKKITYIYLPLPTFTFRTPSETAQPLILTWGNEVTKVRRPENPDTASRRRGWGRGGRVHGKVSCLKFSL